MSGAGLLSTCDNAAMVETGAICAVCHRWRIHGDSTDAGDVFICVGCQADARQFIAIQDAIWGEAAQSSVTSDSCNEEQSPRGTQP